MAVAVSCPKCGSTDVMFSKKRQLYICEDCRNEFAVEHKRASRRIYLSYGIDEHEVLATHIRRDLEERGHEVWYDPDCAREGAERDRYVEAGLDWVSEVPGEGRFVVILTLAAVRRPGGYCLAEIDKAFQRRLPIVPIMADFCEPPLSICRIQWLDMMGCHPPGDNETAYLQKLDALLAAIEQDQADFKGAQSRLLRLLEPLPFDAEVQRHLARFVGRRWIFERVDAWLADPAASRIFWIVGPPGVGKTAIAAWLASNREEVGAFHLCKHGDVLKSDPRRAIMSIAYQLSTQLPDYRDRLNAVNLEKIVRESNAKALFDLLIVQPLSGDFPAPGHVVAILIDALDEASQVGKNELVDLIATEFDRAPAWLRLIITSRPEPEVLQPLQGLTPYKLDTSSPENDRDIRDFLARELLPFADTEEVPADAVDKITAMSEGVFLYVEWIRQELAQQRLSLHRLDEFPRGLTGVYSQFFARQYPVVDAYRRRISPALEVVVAALEPLRLQAIAAMFSWDEYDQADFCQEVGAMFPITDGRVQPFHRSITDWLTDAGKASAYFIEAGNGHRRLADFGWREYAGGAGALTDYMQAHLPAHLIQVERWMDARAMLTDLSYFEIAWKLNEFDVRSCWSRLEELGGIRIVDAYQPIIANPAAYGDRSPGVAFLLFNTSHFGEAGALYDYLIGHYQNKNDLWNLKDSYEKMGLILTYQNSIDDALTMLKMEESLCRELGDDFGLQDCLAHQIVPLYSKGDWESINGITTEMLNHAGHVNKRNLTRMLHMKGLMQFERGSLDEALATYLEKERICREIKDLECLIWTLNMKAVTLYEKGDFQRSLSVSREMEKLCREHGHKLALKFTLINLGDVYYDLGEKEEAVRQLGLARDLCSSLGINKDLDVCLSHLSVISYETGDLDGAMKLLESELALSKEQNDMSSYHVTTGNMAIIYHDQGKLDEAMNMLKEKERFSRDMSLNAGIETAIGNQALIMYDWGDLETAMRLHREEEQICRETSKKKDLFICLYNQANVFLAQGDADTAWKLLTEAEQEFRRLNFMAGLMSCLIGEASLLREQGQPGEALLLYREAEGICRKIDHKKGLVTSLGNQAIVLRDLGDIEDSARLLKEAETLSSSIEFEEGLALSLVNQAILMSSDPGRNRETAARAEHAYQIVKASGLERLVKKIEPLLHSLVKIKSDHAVEITSNMPGGMSCDDGKPCSSPQMIYWVMKKHKLEKK